MCETAEIKNKGCTRIKGCAKQTQNEVHGLKMGCTRRKERRKHNIAYGVDEVKKGVHVVIEFKACSPLFLFRKTLTEAKASSPHHGISSSRHHQHNPRPPTTSAGGFTGDAITLHSPLTRNSPMANQEPAATRSPSAKVVAGHIVHHRSRHRRRRKPTLLSSLARSTPALGAAGVRLLLAQQPRTATPVAAASRHRHRRHHRRHPVLGGVVFENPGVLGLCFLFAYRLEQPLCDTQGRCR